ncbi:RNA ligase family protein [Phytomonospora sp. NPDC050363]|uniref:RNA ligase family protein n=1 Tax=Phytomonospora sp. NPDC050363 TaxID=3155642 RepID=UPI0033E5DBF3
MRVPYPRTPHLPWSPGFTADDLRAGSVALEGREVVVTEKLDGENTTLYRDGLHARSLDSGHHPSRARIKALHGRVGRLIPEGRRVCGENMFARHSIAYDDLDGHFYAFSVWDGDTCLDWDATVSFTRELGLPLPRVLYRGPYDERLLRRLKLDTDRVEGYVVRDACAFTLDGFGERVAKWVRARHVRTDTHWMHAEVVPNGLGPSAALWEVRSGGAADVAAIAALTGLGDAHASVAAEAAARLGDRTGDARLSGVLAALAHDRPRSTLAADLAGRVGVGLARRVADLVGLRPRLSEPFPDEDRRAGLLRMSVSADLGVLHALAMAVAPGEQVEWSALHATELPKARPVHEGLEGDADVIARRWGEAREAFAEGRIRSAAEADALTWRWRAGDFPRLVLTVGPSGSGKSRFAGSSAADEVVSLDGLRAARGGRSVQGDNAAVHREGLARLGAALRGKRTVVWDATALNAHQRGSVHAVAARRDALVTHAVFLVDSAELARRNGAREHGVPGHVLDAQLARFRPPYPGETHRTWYVAPDGSVDDIAGAPDAHQ